MNIFVFNDDRPFTMEDIENMKKVEILELGECFNQPLNNIPENIKTIQIVSDKENQYYPDFNQPLDNLPFRLEKLIVKLMNYDYTLDNLPVELKYLKFMHTHCFQNKDLFCYLPSSLEYLGIFTYMFPDRKKNEPLLDLNNLPSKLKVLEIPLDCYKDCYNLPCNLETLILHGRDNFDYKLDKKIELPNNLNMLILNLDKCKYHIYFDLIKKVFNNKLTCKYLLLKSNKEYINGIVSTCYFNEDIIDIRQNFPNVIVLCDYTL